MKVSINGEPAEVAEVKTVAELAAKYGLAAHTVLIEHNGIALHQHEWSERAVNEGDRVEFVRVVAGG